MSKIILMRKIFLLLFVCLLSISSKAQYVIEKMGDMPFVSMVLPEEEYTTWENGTFNLKRYTQSIYGEFPDEFDFIVFVLNEKEYPADLNYAGISYPISSTESGIGVNPFDNTDYYGSNGKLQNILYMPNKNGLRSGPFLHEICHRWANHAFHTIDMGGNECVAHWGLTGGNTPGQLGGFDQNELIRNVDGDSTKFVVTDFGTTANYGNSVPYTDLELYLMGMLPLSDVRPFDVFQSIDSSSYEAKYGTVTLYSSAVAHYTPEKIEKELGARVPDYSQSQKEFKALFCVLTKEALTDEEKAEYNSQIMWFCDTTGTDYHSAVYNFREATRGVGSFLPYVALEGDTSSVDTISSIFIEELYVMGDIQNVGWNQFAPSALTKVGKNVFEGIYTFSEDTSYFAFCTDFGDWDAVNNSRWAGANNDFVSPDHKGAVVRGGDGSCFTIAKGTYRVTVNMDSLICRVEPTQLDPGQNQFVRILLHVPAAYVHPDGNFVYGFYDEDWEYQTAGFVPDPSAPNLYVAYFPRTQSSFSGSLEQKASGVLAEFGDLEVTGDTSITIADTLHTSAGGDNYMVIYLLSPYDVPVEMFKGGADNFCTISGSLYDSEKKPFSTNTSDESLLGEYFVYMNDGNNLYKVPVNDRGEFSFEVPLDWKCESIYASNLAQSRSFGYGKKLEVGDNKTLRCDLYEGVEDASCDDAWDESLVYWDGRSLSVENPRHNQISIYSANGLLLYGTFSDCVYTFERRGVYLLRMAETTMKLIVK